MAEYLNEELRDASMTGDIDRVMSLIEIGVDIHSRDSDGETALHWACRNGHTAVASLLIERGVDIHSRSNDGWTALHGACIDGLPAVASLLLVNGADIHSRNNYGYTALHKACSYKNKDIATLLIESKADIYIKNNNGKTPLDLRPQWRKELTELYNTINRAWLARKSLLFVLIGGGHVEGVNGGGEPVEEREQSAHERLRDEVLRNVYMSIMSYLGNDGETALQFACTNIQKDTAILLIESKADIYIKNNNGKTPLDIRPEWRKELTELYNTVNRAWLARKSLLFVLIGCGHVESESNKNNASMKTRSGEGGGSSSRVTRSVTRVRARELRDEVLRSVNMSIMSYL